MTDTASALEAARDAYRRREWVEARQRFAEAREHVALAADDLYALGNCSWWLGDLDAALPVQQEAYQRHLDAGQPGPAALVAVDVGYTLTLRGDEAPASGWIARATRLLEDLPDSAEHGYLVHLGFEDAFGSGQLTEAMEAAQRVHALGRAGSMTPRCARWGSSARVGCWCARARWARGWHCSTRRWSPPCPTTSTRGGPATSTAT